MFFGIATLSFPRFLVFTPPRVVATLRRFRIRMIEPQSRGERSRAAPTKNLCALRAFAVQIIPPAAAKRFLCVYLAVIREVLGFLDIS